MVGLFSRKNKVDDTNSNKKKVDIFYDKFERQMEFLRKKIENRNKNREFVGIVMQGKKQMTKIGYPTVNIECNIDNIKDGFYVSKIKIDNQVYNGISFYKKEESIIEMNVLNFCENIYGKKVSIIFIYFLSNLPIQNDENYYEMLKQKFDSNYKTLSNWIKK